MNDIQRKIAEQIVPMGSMEEKIKHAEGTQYFWNNCLTREERENLMDNNETFANRIFKKSGCETRCTNCLCIMDTSTTPIRCTECGGNTVSHTIVREDEICQTNRK